MTRYYDMNGLPIGVLAWAVMYEDPPLIFGTALTDGFQATELARYDTGEAALAGHRRLLAELGALSDGD